MTQKYIFQALVALTTVGGLGLPADPHHCRPDATSARVAKTHDRWRCRCRRRPCTPRHRTGFAFRLPNHVPGVGWRNLHRDRIADRPFALLCLIEMIVIAVKAHLPNGWGFTMQGGGAEFPVMWAILFLVILIRGGGPNSVDRAIGKEF